MPYAEQLKWALLTVLAHVRGILVEHLVIKHPEGLGDVTILLAGDPVFKEGSLNGCINAWNDGSWPPIERPPVPEGGAGTVNLAKS